MIAIAKHDDLVGGKPISRDLAGNKAQGLELTSLKRITKLPGSLGIF